MEIHIWPEELIVGELAAKPNSAPLYPEFSVDWLADEFLYRPMEERTNDRYVISEEVKRTVFDLLQPFWKGKTVSEAKALQVDGRTGATFSSDAVKENVRRALEYYEQHR